MEKVGIVTQPSASKAKKARQMLDHMIGLPDSITKSGHVSSGNMTEGTVTYNWTLHRDSNKRWHYLVEWVDLDGDGHRTVLPHEVITALYRAIGGIHDASRSLGAQKAFQLKRNNGD